MSDQGSSTEGIATPAPLVELSVTLTASSADVWRALVDPDLAPQWMGMRIACSWEVGSAIKITETPLGPRYSERGTLLAFEPGKLLRFSHWSKLWRLPDAPGNRAVMTMRVEPDGDATRLSLRHELPPVEAIAEHSEFFWRGGLYQLSKLLER
jgi:uncharacterized protein YndB with AHSA1/START domain